MTQALRTFFQDVCTFQGDKTVSEVNIKAELKERRKRKNGNFPVQSPSMALLDGERYDGNWKSVENGLAMVSGVLGVKQQ
ncbi:unnamed protein product [Brugia pahangi]|uniref:Transposase n=1 Tax=Brugia pahangi TaxID=6280 RepID=A0A0N4SZI6_BRUPA|nr:unnamed protein product [Brugia pahangi]